MKYNSLYYSYTYDVTQCMFSVGNITEKLRIASLDCTGETVVDMFAGQWYKQQKSIMYEIKTILIRVVSFFSFFFLFMVMVMLYIVDILYTVDLLIFVVSYVFSQLIRPNWQILIFIVVSTDNLESIPFNGSDFIIAFSWMLILSSGGYKRIWHLL